MMATYELWDMRTGNLVGSWGTQADALSVIRRAVARQGAEAIGTLSLLCEDATGNTTLVAEGATLVELAEKAPVGQDRRSA